MMNPFDYARARRGKTYIPIDTSADPMYDVNVHNPQPQEETQMESPRERAHKLPVGTKVRVTPAYLAKHPSSALRHLTGTVVNHGPLYVHVQFPGTGLDIWRMTTEQLMHAETDAMPAPDVNRVHFRYNGTPRSGILNFIEIHSSTGNILMWVREDGTGDLKAFNLAKLDPMQRHVGAILTKSVTVEGIKS